MKVGRVELDVVGSESCPEAEEAFVEVDVEAVGGGHLEVSHCPYFVLNDRDAYAVEVLEEGELHVCGNEHLPWRAVEADPLLAESRRYSRLPGGAGGSRVDHRRQEEATGELGLALR